MQLITYNLQPTTAGVPCLCCEDKPMKSKLVKLKGLDGKLLVDEVNEKFFEQHQFIDGTCGSRICMSFITKLKCESYVVILNGFITLNVDKYPLFSDFKNALCSLAAEHTILIHAKNDTLIAGIEAETHTNVLTVTPASQNEAEIVQNLRTAITDSKYIDAQRAADKKNKNLKAIKSINKKKKKVLSSDDDDFRPRRTRAHTGHLPAQVTPTPRIAGPVLALEAGPSNTGPSINRLFTHGSQRREKSNITDYDAMTAAAMAASLPHDSESDDDQPMDH